MAHPASWQNQIPPDEAGIMRRLEDIERQMRELGPAIQSAVGPQIATLQAQAAFLLGQTVEDERDPGTTLTFTASSDADTGVVWWPADAGDSSVGITTSSTGRIRVDVSGAIDALGGGYGEATGYIGFEVLSGATPVVAPAARHGTFVVATGIGFGSATTGPGDGSHVGLYAAGLDLLTLSPTTAYTVRTRRGYRTRSLGVAPGTAWNTAIVTAQTTRIAVTKLGL